MSTLEQSRAAADAGLSGDAEWPEILVAEAALFAARVAALDIPPPLNTPFAPEE